MLPILGNLRQLGRVQIFCYSTTDFAVLIFDAMEGEQTPKNPSEIALEGTVVIQRQPNKQEMNPLLYRKMWSHYIVQTASSHALFIGTANNSQHCP